MWRGGDRFGLSVAAPFVWRCPNNSAVGPFPHSPHRSGLADFPHPALGQDVTPSSTPCHVQARSVARARCARTDARVDSSRPSVPELVLVEQPPTQPRRGVVVERTVCTAGRAHTEVVRPAAQRAVQLVHLLRGLLPTRRKRSANGTLARPNHPSPASGWSSPTTPQGLPVLRALSLCTCCRHYPGTATGGTALLIRPVMSAFPERVIRSACALTFSRLTQRSLALRPAHSRCHLIVARLPEGFRHFVTSMPAPVASGWSGCRSGLAPAGKAPPFHGANPLLLFADCMHRFARERCGVAVEGLGTHRWFPEEDVGRPAQRSKGRGPDRLCQKPTSREPAQGT